MQYLEIPSYMSFQPDIPTSTSTKVIRLSVLSIYYVYLNKSVSTETNTPALFFV